MNFIANNSDIFFFVTTIFVTVLIIIALFILAIILRIRKFIKKLIEQGESIMEDNKDNKILNTGLSIILPILSVFAKSKKRKK